MKKYEMIITDDGDNFTIKRVCDGFNLMEILGILEHARHEIIQQMAGDIKPDKVTRTVIMD